MGIHNIIHDVHPSLQGDNLYGLKTIINNTIKIYL